MKNADKNRDPEIARARAKTDARCALGKIIDPTTGESLRDLIDSLGKGEHPCSAAHLLACILEAVAK